MCLTSTYFYVYAAKLPTPSGSENALAFWICSMDLATVSHDSGGSTRNSTTSCHRTLRPCRGRSYRMPKVILPFSQYRNPAQTSLGSLRDQELEEKPIVVSWHYPFLSWYSNIRGSFHTHCTVLPLILAKMLATIHSILGIRWYKAIKTSPRSRDTGGCCRLWPTPAPGSESGR